MLTSHLTGAQYRLTLAYQRTETVGPLFEQMKAKLVGIASHTGMSEVFRLLGSDVYRILAIEQVPGPTVAPPPPVVNHLTALRRATGRLASCGNLERLLETALDCLGSEFGFGHVMLLMHDEGRGRLYTLASRGYPQSGIGSEIPVGAGVIGICARERIPIRIGFMTSEYGYGRAIRDGVEADGQGDGLETAIPLPGLPEARSQLAVPITAFDRLLEMGANGPEKDLTRGLSGHPEQLMLGAPPKLDNDWNWAGSATMTAFVGPWGTTYAANLTPDRETGIGSWKEKDFVQAMRTGRHVGVARPIMPPMPWQAIGQLPDSDLRAIYAYLQAQPAVKNKVPEYAPPANATAKAAGGKNPG